MKMDDDTLLSLLQAKEEQSATYIHGQLAGEREKAMREYNREPLGNEEEGWSTIVSSDVQDTVEWILPTLLDIFSSTDKAVSFEPTSAEDEKGAEQATDACNYVFYKQNNGFLTLYTAIKDSLVSKNCAVMWRKVEEEVSKTDTFNGLSEDQLNLIMQGDGSKAELEIVAADQQPAMGPDGMPAVDPMTGMPQMTISAKIKRTEKKQKIKIEAFPPEDLLIERNWTSPLLQDCPYVCRTMRVTLSDLRTMGYDVDKEDLGGGDDAGTSADATYRANKAGEGIYEDESEDDSLAEGWLRIEFVLVDVDGDGIAERRCIYRLKDKILKNEECSHVPIATASPIVNPHRWDGMSMAECVSDLMHMKTEIMRQTLNSLYLSNNPRTKVLTDSNWSPLANLDDLLDARPGGLVRQRDVNAVAELVTPFVGGQSFPMLEYIDGMRENRTGVTRYNQGIDANSLNKTASGINQIMSASQQRIKLMARIYAETLVKPIFQGLLKLLTEGGMDKLSFRLNNDYVQMDPNEWRDWYDMTINVGLGAGDKDQQGAHLQMIFQNQMNLMQFGLCTPQEIFHTQSKMAENAGFKNVGDFFIDPKSKPPEPPQPQQPPPEVQKAQLEGQMKQQELQQKGQQHQAELQQQAQMRTQELQLEAQKQQQQAQNDMQERQHKAQLDAQLEQQKFEFERWKVERQEQTKLQIAQINAQVTVQTAQPPTSGFFTSEGQ